MQGAGSPDLLPESLQTLLLSNDAPLDSDTDLVRYELLPAAELELKSVVHLLGRLDLPSQHPPLPSQHGRQTFLTAVKSQLVQNLVQPVRNFWTRKWSNGRELAIARARVLEKRIAEYRLLLAPQRRIPNEILEAIFQNAMPSYLSPLEHHSCYLAQVCARWRAVFWNCQTDISIVLTQPLTGRTAWHIRHALELTSAKQLRVVIHVGTENPRQDQLLLDEIIQVLVSSTICSRLSELHLSGHFMAFRFIMNAQHRYPQLTKLHLECYPHPDLLIQGSTFKHAVRLTDVCIHRPKQDILKPPYFVPLQQLRSLLLVVDQYHDPTRILSQCPLLEHLQILSDRDSPLGSVQSTVQGVVHANIRRVEVLGCAWFATCTSLPALKDVNISYPENILPMVSYFKHQTTPTNLTTLVFHKGIVNTPLVEILGMVPRLEALMLNSIQTRTSDLVKVLFAALARHRYEGGVEEESLQPQPIFVPRLKILQVSVGAVHEMELEFGSSSRDLANMVETRWPVLRSLNLSLHKPNAGFVREDMMRLISFQRRMDLVIRVKWNVYQEWDVYV